MKTDRIDVLSLLNAILAVDRGERHVCSIVLTLGVEEEDGRRSHRKRDRLIQEWTTQINRIKTLLFAQGIREVELRLRRARVDFGALKTGEGHPLPPRFRAALEREYARLNMVNDQLRTIEKKRDLADAQDPAVEVKRQRFERLQGVGWAASSIMAIEVFARSFASRRRLASYLGLMPSAYDSGLVTRCQGISKAGNSWARRILIEISWLWLRHQPQTALAQWYGQRTRRQGQRVRRVMQARKLAVVLWLYSATGDLPYGATLSRQAA